MSTPTTDESGAAAPKTEIKYKIAPADDHDAVLAIGGGLMWGLTEREARMMLGYANAGAAYTGRQYVIVVDPMDHW